MSLLQLLKRDDLIEAAAVPSCATENDIDASLGLRILSIFMILLSSGLGTFFPLLASRFSFIRLPEFCWFFAKFFGSGVIIATGFMHLLQPAAESLSEECLGDDWTGYPWAFAICLISLFVLFLSEIVAHHFVAKASGALDNDQDIEMQFNHSHFGNPQKGDHSHNHNSHDHTHSVEVAGDSSSSKISFTDDLERNLIVKETEQCSRSHSNDEIDAAANLPSTSKLPPNSSIPGANHFSHDASHESLTLPAVTNISHEKYLNQVLSVFVLEFGVIFHSIFVGLSLAVSGDEFKTLFIVLVFHQMFEGLGLGTRIAETPWNVKSRYTPWILAFGFTVSTPIAIGIGIGVSNSFIPGSRSALISNGIFDAISSGILIYTGIVELMAHEFLYSNQFKKKDGLIKMLGAYLLMCLGAGLMALLAKWA